MKIALLALFAGICWAQAPIAGPIASGGGGGGGGGASPAGSAGQVQLKGAGSTFSVQTTSPTTVSASSTAGTPVIGAEILTNGDFMSGDLTGWTVSPGGSWVNTMNQAVGSNGGQLSQATGLTGQVIVTIVISAIGTPSGGYSDLEIYNDDTFQTQVYQTGTYVFIMNANNINFYADGDGWTLVSVSAKPYSNPSMVSLLGPSSDFSFNFSGNSTSAGYLAGQNNSGTQLTAFGYLAGQNNSGNDNTFFGWVAGQEVALGNVSNTGIGSAALRSSFGDYVTGVGQNALESSNGSFATAVGAGALSLNGANAQADYSTAVGYNAAHTKHGGGGSTFVGADDVVTGSQKNIENSTVLGSVLAGTAVNNSGMTQLTNIIAINGAATDSNQTVIGNSGTASVALFGTLKLPTMTGAGKLPLCAAADGTISLGTNTAGVLACP